MQLEGVQSFPGDLELSSGCVCEALSVQQSGFCGALCVYDYKHNPSFRCCDAESRRNPLGSYKE